jgi:hypothetical protein
MRNSTPFIIAATVLLAAPAAAQDNVVTATNTATADPAVSTTNDLDSANAVATAPTNGLTADPMAPATDPAATDPALTDPAYGAPVEEEEDGRFPWGLLGLLGLAGLIPRKPAARRHDGAI